MPQHRMRSATDPFGEAELDPTGGIFGDPFQALGDAMRMSPHGNLAEEPRGYENVVYLGLNDASRETERKVFTGADHATVLTGAGKDAAMQGKTLAADGKTVLDLTKEEDVQTFLKEAGVGARRVGIDGKPTETKAQADARLAALEAMFLGKKKDGKRDGSGLDVGVRDEMADFLRHVQKVENGEAFMDRLILSGHSGGGHVYSEAEGSPGLGFRQLGQLMKHFPKARNGVEDLMLSACHTLEEGYNTKGGAQYRDIFPFLRSTWGYDGTSPDYKQGSDRHIRAWLNASKGNDPTEVKKATAGRIHADAVVYE
jgi:hypothetical protein